MKHLKSITRTCASLAVILLAGCNTNFKEFEALTVNRSGSFELDMTPEYALPLFTAPGECCLWGVSEAYTFILLLPTTRNCDGDEV